MAQPCSRAFFSLSLQFPTVVTSVLCFWTDNFTINFGSRKTHLNCSVISHGSGADIGGSPLVCLVKEIGSEERRHGRRSVTSLLQQQAQFLQQTVEQQTNAHTQAMNAMAEMLRALHTDVRASAESKFLVNDKESMTSKGACTMLLHSSGKVEEYETWRFQLIQFLSQEVSRVDRG